MPLCLCGSKRWIEYSPAVHPPTETHMYRIIASCSILLAIANAGCAQDFYGSIADLKLADPADAKDTPSVAPPKDAIVLFDGKSLDGWTKKDGKSAAHWKLAGGGIVQVRGGGDIITKQKFDGKFKLHVEFRVPYMPK